MSLSLQFQLKFSYQKSATDVNINDFFKYVHGILHFFSCLNACEKRFQESLLLKQRDWDKLMLELECQRLQCSTAHVRQRMSDFLNNLRNWQRRYYLRPTTHPPLSQFSSAHSLSTFSLLESPQPHPPLLHVLFNALSLSLSLNQLFTFSSFSLVFLSSHALFLPFPSCALPSPSLFSLPFPSSRKEEATWYCTFINHQLRLRLTGLARSLPISCMHTKVWADLRYEDLRTVPLGLSCIAQSWYRVDKLNWEVECPSRLANDAIVTYKD